jgi:hypothetical protein
MGDYMAKQRWRSSPEFTSYNRFHFLIFDQMASISCLMPSLLAK